jgi:hypothetical protein
MIRRHAASEGGRRRVLAGVVVLVEGGGLGILGLALAGLSVGIHCKVGG